MSDRDDLRRKLREKIRHKREGSSVAGPQLAQRFRSDPTTTMMSMGIDDPSLLNQAKTIVKNPEGFLKNLSADLKAKPHRVPDDELPTCPDSVGSDDEEAPPPFEN